MEMCNALRCRDCLVDGPVRDLDAIEAPGDRAAVKASTGRGRNTARRRVAYTREVDDTGDRVDSATDPLVRSAREGEAATDERRRDRDGAEAEVGHRRRSQAALGWRARGAHALIVPAHHSRGGGVPVGTTQQVIWRPLMPARRKSS